MKTKEEIKAKENLYVELLTHNHKYDIEYLSQDYKILQAQLAVFNWIFDIESRFEGDSKDIMFKYLSSKGLNDFIDDKKDLEEIITLLGKTNGKINFWDTRSKEFVLCGFEYAYCDSMRVYARDKQGISLAKKDILIEIKKYNKETT